MEEEVIKFLTNLKQEKYIDAFAANEIFSMDIVKLINEKDLEGMEIKLGARKKIINAIKELGVIKVPQEVKNDEKIDEKMNKDSLFNADSLHDHVVSLQSLHNPGHYLCSSKSKFDDKRVWSSVNGCNHDEVVINPHLKFLVHKIDDNIILLESMSRRNWYLAMISNCIPLNFKEKTNGIKYVGRMAVIEHSYNTPLNDKHKRFQWKIVGDKPDCFALASCCYPTHYLSGHWSKKWNITGRARPYTKKEQTNEKLRQWSKWKLCIAGDNDITDDYVAMESLQNETNVETLFQVSLKIGISSSKSKSEKNSFNIAIEIQKNFGDDSLNFASAHVKSTVSYGHEWTSSTSETWSKETTKMIEIKVPPKTNMRVLQLRGKYGPFEIGSSHWKVQEYK